jgi:hypothetical protein
MGGIDNLLSAIASVASPILRLAQDMRVIIVVACGITALFAYFVVIPAIRTLLWWLIRTLVLILSAK